MIKAVIIDDEPAAVNTLQLMLDRYIPEIKQVKTSNDPEKAIQLIKTFKPQLVFLDIQMPTMTGFDLLKKLPEINFTIIFTTAHHKYAIEALRFSALDYLMKPIDADELRQAVDKFMARTVVALGQQTLYQNLLHNITAKDRKDFKLALPTSEGTYFFKPEEIIRLEGEINYTWFHFINRKPLLISRTLKEYEDILNDHGFLRIHKSHLINKTHVVNYTQHGTLTLSDLSQVDISRRRKEIILEALRSR
ncbi:response regulator transcription factor [Pseudoflavitalea sp. G-6-1-2]|uniref:response regulator n=1 Tax=Pseudoflavitalea sp. G-6-1-2 TaxID=2728841 RepID=UPI00146E274F|nr:response regulator transcription factor [Pseudoflavitalea sp. G-6-1-2]